MKRLTKLSIIFLPLLLCVMILQPIYLIAQSGSEIYRHLSSRDGLSNSFVWEMIQDRNGFIWIAGNNGLDRYDGYNAYTFRNDPNDESTITPGAVFKLYEDENGFIWIGGGMGLNIFNPATETFKRVQTPDPLLAMQVVRGITRSTDGFVWVSGISGLYRFSPDTPEATDPDVEFFEFDESMENPPLIQSIEEGSDDMIWVGTDQGLLRFDKRSGSFEKPGPFEESLDRVLSSPIWMILKDRNNNVWITSEFGFAVWRDGADEPELITELGDGELDLTDAYMQSIFEDDDGTLWIGTGEIGAFTYHPETGEVNTFRHNSSDTNSITEDDIHYIFKDADNNVWFGYHNVSISIMYTQPWQYEFTPLIDSPGTIHPLNNIHTIVDDAYGNLWLATHRGLVRTGTDNGEMDYFLPDPQNQADENTDNHLGRFIFDDEHFLAMTHSNNFQLFSVENEQFTDIQIPDSLFVNSFFEASDSHYYIGTFQNGLLLEVDKQTLDINIIEVPRREPDNSENRAVIPIVSAEGNVYIKYGYLESQNFTWDYFLFNPEGGTFTDLDIQTPAGIGTFYPPLLSPSEEGIVWTITNLGLLRQDLLNKESRFLFQNDASIISQNVVELFEDNEGFLWLGGTTGIIKMDTTAETLTLFEADQNRKPTFFRNPTQLENGDILFGGDGGFTRFDPNLQLEDPTIQYTHITELRSGAESYSTLNYEGNFGIEYANNNITISYLALNYRNPATTRYRYRLIGYNDMWTEVGTQRSVFLANLPPGDYTFQVQAGQRFGNYSDTVAELNLAILPPWWRTLPAYLFFALLFAGGVFTIDRVQRRRVISKEREMAREKELSQAKEIEKAYEHLKAAQDQLVQQEKLASLGQLTAGIAHEIKNPLNFVNNFSELSVELIEEARKELSAVSSQISAKGEVDKVDEALDILNDIEINLRKIHEHGSRADSIVKSMLEHSRGGSGEMEPTDLNALVKEFVNLTFHGMRASKDPINVDMEFDLDESIVEVPLIAEDFSRVIVNLCNNGFDAMREKMTGDGGPKTGKMSPFEGGAGVPDGTKVGDDTASVYHPKLTIRTYQKDSTVTIEIEDNGPGIPEEIKDKIMQPFFTTKKGTAGTGLGLSISNDIIKAHGGDISIKSVENARTTFVIKIPNDLITLISHG